MDEISRLLLDATEAKPDAEAARQELVRRGESAVKAIVDAVTEGNAKVARQLGPVMARIKSAAGTAAALRLIISDDTNQMLFGFEVLERSRDRSAVRPLIDYFLDETHLPTGRRLAARALGEIGDPAALDALKKGAQSAGGGMSPESILSKANEEYDFDPPTLSLIIAKASAQLGDHSLAPLAVFFAGHTPAPEDAPEVSYLRELATEALEWVVGDGMIAALRAALKEGSYEIQLSAINALFYLGLADVGHDLMTVIGIPGGVGGNARNRMHDLAGAPLTDSVDELRAWWMANAAELPKDACLRFGRPIQLHYVIDEMKQPAFIPQITRELRVRTGQDFSLADDPYEAATAWLAAEGKALEPGALYKAGTLLSLPKG